MCFIFPNRRAAKFFIKHLSEEVKARGDVPQTVPATLTINDFFYKAAGKVPTDRTTLLLELYTCYSALAAKAEPLDDFIFWGDVLLSDFDDVDKYLVDPSQLFRNVSELKEMQDDFSYLSDNQREAMERFLGHFGAENGEYKKRFLTIWDILLKLYVSFRQVLDSKGLSYEGQVYRSLAERLGPESVADILSECFAGTEKFVFCGLNALNECEKKVLRSMEKAGMAEFCWDYSSEMIKNPLNRSSFFMEENIREFPQAFKPDPEGLPIPEINVLSVPSRTGQAKQLPEIFRRTGTSGIETAVVLPEEELLIPVINSIPPEIGELNVTMGYPMRGSELWSLFKELSALQAHVRNSGGSASFYHKQVWAIFSNSIVKSVLSEKGRAAEAAIKKDSGYYVNVSDFGDDELLSAIFRPVGSSGEIPSYLLGIIKLLAAGIRGMADMEVELEFAKILYETVENLGARELGISPATWFKLLEKIAAGTSVPFTGEPLGGVQVMGPLETRALDFRNVILLSCNEGIFPRRAVSSSFIPPQLRKGFGLPTYEHQDTVWAYYFYRLIQRAENVWLLYDSRAEGMRGGEPSRYIRQLEMHFGLPVKHLVVKAPISRAVPADVIAKTEAHVAALRAKGAHLSASSLQNYLSCPAMFYYGTVCGLKEQNEVAESLDSGMQGRVFHSTMEALYNGRKEIIREELKAIMNDKAGIAETVSRYIMEQMHSREVSGVNILYKNIVCRYVEQALRKDLELMDRYEVGKFSLFGLEQKEKMKIGDFEFIGYIDRLDSFSPDEVRIVDYKTGKVSDEDFLINDGNAETVVEALFGEDNGKRPKIALQLYLYDRFVAAHKEFAGKKLVNSIYHTSRMFTSDVDVVELSPRFLSLMEERLGGLLDEISDTEIPWRKKGDENTCKYCSFKMICGK